MTAYADVMCRVARIQNNKAGDHIFAYGVLAYFRTSDDANDWFFLQ